MGSIVSAEKSAARKCGCTVEEWRAKRANNQRWCYSCRTWQDINEFSIDRNRISGRACICRPCNSDRSKRSKYGLTVEQFAALKETHCPICKRDMAVMVIDHCHETGKVRAGLCSRCNVGMGLFSDSPDLLRAAAEYLEKHRG